MNLFDGTISLLEKTLDYSSLRQKIIAQNIANADTPNYKARDVSFRSFLEGEMSSLPMKVTDPKHLPKRSSSGSRAVVTVNHNVRYNENGNSVDMDNEMVKMAENQIYYYALAERISGKFESLKMVIKGSGQ